jgi:hypothetical protein
VLDIEEVAKEIRDLKKAGVLTSSDQLKISDQCTALLSYHQKLDAAREAAMGSEKIGTTGKGIGPAYEDRASRKAILFGDLFDRERLKQKLEVSLEEKNFMLEKYFKQEPVAIPQARLPTKTSAPFRTRLVGRSRSTTPKFGSNSICLSASSIFCAPGLIFRDIFTSSPKHQFPKAQDRFLILGTLPQPGLI